MYSNGRASRTDLPEPAFLLVWLCEPVNARVFTLLYRKKKTLGGNSLRADRCRLLCGLLDRLDSRFAGGVFARAQSI